MLNRIRYKFISTHLYWLMKIMAFFWPLIVEREGLKLSFRAKNAQNYKNSIFSEFMKIVKNTLALILFNVINNTHYFFIIVQKIITQSDSLGSRRVSKVFNQSLLEYKATNEKLGNCGCVVRPNICKLMEKWWVFVFIL